MKVDVKTLNLMELFQMYSFIRADADRSFSNNQNSKIIVKTRLNEVESELYSRLYGCNPFITLRIEGQTPESIDLSKFDSVEEPKTYVVHDGNEPQNY